MAGGDSYHNFPESFDQTIFDQGARTVVPNYFNKAAPLLSNDSVRCTLPGSINGVEGEYQIFSRPSLSGSVELIMHASLCRTDMLLRDGRSFPAAYLARELDELPAGANPVELVSRPAGRSRRADLRGSAAGL
jgi:hypothetical protein